MKEIIYLLVVVLISACSSEPHYVVKGDIDGSDGVVFLIRKREGGKTITIDSAVSRKGSFKLKGGSIDYPQLIKLVARDTKKSTSFYLENSNISVTGMLDSLYKAEIYGSITQDEYRSFVDSNEILTDRYSDIYTEYQTARQAEDFVRVAVLEEQAVIIQEEMKTLQKNFVKNNPGSFVSPSILASLSYEMEADEIESIINAMDTAVAAIPQVVSLKERVAVMKAVTVGKKAPDFIMNDVNGNPVALSSKIGPKLLLIDFWAAWCAPCRQENPNIVKVYTEFGKEGFDVFGVSLDEEKEDWVKAIANDRLSWTQVSDLQYWSNAAAKMYAVDAIPANFLLDETGTIIARNLRGEDLYNKVKEVLGE